MGGILLARGLVFVLVVSAGYGQDVGNLGGLRGGSFYDGPSILGRGGYGVGARGVERVPIRGSFGVNGTYDSALINAQVDKNGRLVATPAYGVEGVANVSGQHRFRRAYVGLNYMGNYARFNQGTGFNGSNHMLNLGYAARLTRNLELFSQTAAGTSNRFVGAFGYTMPNDFEFLAVPAAELFDNRTSHLANSSGLIYALGRRQSIRLVGTGSTIRRRSPALADVRTYGASADWVAQLSRRTSIGVSYTFNHFDFKQVFGESDIHAFSTHFSRLFGRSWELSLAATALQQSTVGVRQFDLDPQLAELLGRPRGIEVFESNSLLYGGFVNLTRRIRRSNLAARIERGVVPGNGFFLTSINESASVAFDRPVNRRFHLNAALVYNRFTSLGFAAGKFSGWTAGGGASYLLTQTLGVNARYDRRTFELDRSAFQREGNRVVIGLTYNPTPDNWKLW